MNNLVTFKFFFIKYTVRNNIKFYKKIAKEIV